MSYETRDSGERAQWASGMQRDTAKSKPRFDLIAPLDLPYEKQMLTRWARLMQRGAEKYDPRNWEKAKTEEELHRFRESAFRHFMQWYLGTDDGEDHAAAVFFNVTGAEYVKHRIIVERLRANFEAAVNRPARVIVLDAAPRLVSRFRRGSR